MWNHNNDTCTTSMSTEHCVIVLHSTPTVSTHCSVVVHVSFLVRATVSVAPSCDRYVADKDVMGVCFILS